MAHIRIEQFAGILPELNSRLKPKANAQIAHNCLLTDGSLRPQARWVQQQEFYAGYEASIRGIAYDKQSDSAVMYASFDPITLKGSPFAADTTVGASPASLVNRYKTGAGLQPQTVAIYSDGVAGNVTYERSFDSIKPVNRIYATTRVRKIGERVEEGSLIPIGGQSASSILYEGDLVTITLNAAQLDDGATHIRIYRTISGLDTGQAIGNELDTKWYLVDELPLVPGNVVTYIDGNSATAIPLDLNYSQKFHPPSLVARYFGLSESGWFVAGSLGGDIQVSERYMHHAWPTENDMQLQGVEITDLAVHLNNVYIGTTEKPYIVALSFGDKALQAAAQPYGEVMPCLPNSMAPAASGALYASGAGVVALGREGMSVLSQDVANAGDTLYTKAVDNGRVTAKISNTSFGAYFSGKYYAFCEGPPIDDGVYYTSTLYSMEFRDDMQSSAFMLSGAPSPYNFDSMASNAIFAGGELRALLDSYVMPGDADGQAIPTGLHIVSSADFISGTIETILVTTTVTPEVISYDGLLVGGSLDTILVTSTVQPDKLGSYGTLSSGSIV